MKQIECFIVLMYSKGCGAVAVNEASHHLFTTKCRSLETFYLPKLHFSSMWSKHYYRLVSSEIRQSQYSRKSLTSVTGVDRKMAPESGNHCGPLLGIQLKLVEFWCIVAAWKHAQKSANVCMLVLVAQISANVKEAAQIITVVISRSHSNICDFHPCSVNSIF